MRRIIVYVFPFYLSGIIIYNNMSYYLIGAVLSALFFITYIKKYKFKGLFCLIFIIIGFVTASIHTIEYNKSYTRLLNSNNYEGYIIEKDKTNYVVKNYKDNYKVILSIYKDINAYPGDYITFHGKVAEKPDYKKKILNSQGIDAYIKDSGEDLSISKNNNILLFPARIKYKINTALIGIDKEGGSFVSGLITGYTNEINDGTMVNFQDLGISHILAVSGFNIGIIFYLMIILTKRLNAKTRYSLTLLTCFIYTAIGGFEPSIFRAFLMITIIISAKFLNRFYDIVSGITLSAFVMLLFNSFYIFNIGFLLSYIATYGIILLSKDIEDKIPARLNKFSSEISVGMAAFIATLPIMLWYRGYFSLLSIIVNVIVSPFIAFTTILGFVSTVIYTIIGLKIILYPSVFIGVIFIKIINYISKYNSMVYPGMPSYFFIITYYTLIGTYFGYIKIPIAKYNRSVFNIILCILLVISLVIHGHYLKIHFINVGQGDSIFIETPDRKSILVDTGPVIENYSALKSKVLPYIKRQGYNKLDMLILTHFHNDHAGDYKYLLENYKVNKIVVYKKPIDNSLALYDSVEVLRNDSIKIGDLIINVLFPEGNIENTDDKNETCLVLEVIYKDFSMLLTADADESTMDLIKGNYDVLKVPHHGSINSFSKIMLDNSNIGIAVISVGKNNFGHPSKIVINELKKRNIRVYRTDLDGNITIVTQGENYKLLFQ